MPSLLDLPRELRDQISSLALTHPAPFSLPSIYPDYHRGGRATTTLTRSHLALTQTNRQLRAETRTLFYASNAFAICLQPVVVSFWRLGKDKRKRDKMIKIFRRSYGDWKTWEWICSLPDEAVAEMRSFTVYFACVTRWRGDEGIMERVKFKAYKLGEVPGKANRRITEHVLYDMCSGGQLFYELDLETDEVESFVEVPVEKERRGEELWGGTECDVCLGLLQKWLDSVSVVDGKKRVDRAKLEELVWPSGLEPTDEVGRGDSRI